MGSLHSDFDLLADAVLGIGVYIAAAFGFSLDHALLADLGDLGVAGLIGDGNVCFSLFDFSCWFWFLPYLAMIPIGHCLPGWGFSSYCLPPSLIQVFLC